MASNMAQCIQSNQGNCSVLSLLIAGILLIYSIDIVADETTFGAQTADPTMHDALNFDQLNKWRDYRTPKRSFKTEQEQAVAYQEYFAAMSVIYPIMEACQTDIQQTCKEEYNPLGCLVDNYDSLNSCCASHIRSANGSPAIPKALLHYDVMLPAQSSLIFDSSCTISKAILSESSSYKGTKLHSSAVYFDQSGEIGLAQLKGNINWQGLPLAEDQPPTRISKAGIPEYVRLSGPARYKSFDLEPLQLSTRNSIESFDWQAASMDDVFYLLANYDVDRDPGTTRLFPNGHLARGQLSKPTLINGLPIAPGITTFTDKGQLLLGALSTEAEYDGMTLSAGPVSFSESGQLLIARLARPYQHGELSIAAGEVTFHDNGQFKTATLQAGSELNSVSLPSKVNATFTENGELNTIHLVPADSIDRIKFGTLTLRADRSYQVHENGQPKEVWIEEHTLYRDRLYPQSTNLKFDHSGVVVWDSFHNEVLQNQHNKERGMLPEVLPFAQVRQGVFFPKGSIVYPGYDGSTESAILSRPVQYNGVLLAAKKIKFSNLHSFLSVAALHGHQTINGVTFKGAPDSVIFDETGNISHGILHGDQTINGIWFADGTGFNYFPDQSPRKGYLAKNTVIDGIPLASDSVVHFYANGKIHMATLWIDHTINGMKYKQGTALQFNIEGNLGSGTLAIDTNSMGTVIPAGTKVRLVEGKLRSLDLKQNISVQGHHLDGRGIEFYENGVLRTGVLAKDANIEGSKLKAGSQLLLDESGKLIGTDFVGMIEPPEEAKSKISRSANGAVTVLVGRKKLAPLLLSPPTKETCRKIFDGELTSGSSLGSVLDSIERQCGEFYAEFRE